ncbi:AAA family ATPase, partial [Patescibacteria group bacterium]|nr:AAA family ATPase [Patescibacteria group bacterium]
EKIKLAKYELEDGLVGQIQQFTRTLQGDDGAGGKKGELAKLETAFEEQCWALKLKHDPKLQGAFQGVRGKKRDFKDRLLTEAKRNVAALKPLDELEKKAESIFGETHESAALISVPNYAKLLALESNPILKRKIIGKSDVDITAMIRKLGNSDWVKEGRAFYEVNDKFCPFCQQRTTDSLSKSLSEYFDEAYLSDTKAIEQIFTDYRSESERLQQSIQVILTDPSKFLDVEKLKSEKELLDSKIRLNLQRIEKKRKESSQSIELDALANVLEAMKGVLDVANKAIVKHNDMVSNLARERQELTAEFWKYMLEVEIKTQLASYTSSKDALDKAITSINARITSTEAEKRKKEIELRGLEKNTTSIQPTINEINTMLSSFGFRSFRLAKSDKIRFYKIVREDGSDVKDTLSEGEKNFITFLYFYHLLKGSESETGTTTNRIVVFDDPVSSLDSDVLFIVSTLIKGLFEEVRTESGHIKQIFVLTHNVYFHKEITFNKRRMDKAMNEETFWIVKKPDKFSIIQQHFSNPIKTSYDLLWSDVRSTTHQNLSIQNTLRRILENYFKILGNVDPDEICSKFEGKEKLICKSLFSWVHDGSHSVHDDVYISIDDTMVERYLTVFKEIFSRNGHLAHYKMMMKDSSVESSTDPILQQKSGVASITP